MLLTGLILLVLGSTGLGAMLGWYAALAVVRIRVARDQWLVDQQARNACSAIVQISWRAQETLHNLTAEGLSQRQW